MLPEGLLKGPARPGKSYRCRSRTGRGAASPGPPLRVVRNPPTPPSSPASDAEDVAAIVEDIRRGLDFIRRGQGYGRVVVTIEVRPTGLAGWEVGPTFSRKPGKKGTGE